MTINITSAKNYFSELMQEIQNGKDYTIIKLGKPIAKIIPIKDDDFSRNKIVEDLFHFQEKQQ
ncbi:type II toxin-antitoxin system Phd/YefM family antitoxin [Breznakiellaceae bacterium SP9]